MHLEVTFDFFGQSDLVCEWIDVDQWEASLQNQIIWVITYSNVMLVCVSVSVWFQINAVWRVCGWYFAYHRLPSFLWQVSTLDSASADLYHLLEGTAHFTKSIHFHCYLLAFLLNINGQRQCMISKTQTSTFKEHQLELDPGWPAWPHCPYAGAPRTFPWGVPWYLSKTLACQVYQVLSSILSHPSPEYLVWFGDAMLPLGLVQMSQ